VCVWVRMCVMCLFMLSLSPERSEDGNGSYHYVSNLQTQSLFLPGRSPTLGSALAGSQ
jgi:hypothetical protein